MGFVFTVYIMIKYKLTNLRCAPPKYAQFNPFVLHMALIWRITVIKRPYALLYNKLIPIWKCSNNIMMHLLPFLCGVKLCVLLLSYLWNGANIDSHCSCYLTTRVTEVINCCNYTSELISLSEEKPSWSWWHGSWIYNYLCNQCLSPLTFWVRTPFMARCTWYNTMW